MAEFLIKAVSTIHADVTKSQRGCYKRGDIVDLRPDGFEWGRLEGLAPKDGGQFVVVKVVGVTVDQVRTFAENKLGILATLIIPETSGTDVSGNPLVTKRRRIRLDVDLLPAGVRDTLNNTGSYSTTWAAIKAYLIDKVSNTSF